MRYSKPEKNPKRYKWKREHIEKNLSQDNIMFLFSVKCFFDVVGKSMIQNSSMCFSFAASNYTHMLFYYSLCCTEN